MPLKSFIIDKSADEVLIEAMEKIQGSKTARIIVIMDNVGDESNLCTLNANVDYITILGMLKYALMLEERMEADG